MCPVAPSPVSWFLNYGGFIKGLVTVGSPLHADQNYLAGDSKYSDHWALTPIFYTQAGKVSCNRDLSSQLSSKIFFYLETPIFLFVFLEVQV